MKQRVDACIRLALAGGVAIAFAMLIGCRDRARDTVQQADKIVIVKSAHTMTLYAHGQRLRTYKVSLGRGNGAPKVRAGDHNTPEGTYIIDARNAHSHFHRALHISYPNTADRAHAANLHATPGGDIMIHGLRNSLGWIGALHRHIDWTDGCIALTDPEMDEVWQSTPLGTPVEIKP